ncbi:MAG: peptidoglycan DD-metalloendopeptidase family protein, partial [Candidatus Eisenbacteria bacterium]
KYVKRLTNRENVLDRQLLVTTAEVGRARKNLGLQRDLLAWRVREIYKYGRTRMFEFLFSSASFAQLLSRFRYLAFVAESDKQLMDGYQTHKLDVEQSETKVKRQIAEINGLKSEKEKEQRNLGSLRQKRRQSITQIQSERKSYEEAARELERAAARTKSILEELEKRRREELAGKLPAPEWMAHAEFEKNRGALNWPVPGSVASKFGNNKHPRFGTTVFNPGIDIAAPHGTDIKAVARGRVDYSSWLTGLGNCIILSHGGGYYTIYAHAAEVFVRVGQEVSPGQVVGKVGDSGSMKGSCLHFEVRKGKEALDPSKWLR